MSTPDYENEFVKILASISNTLSSINYTKIIFEGDLNLELKSSNFVFNVLTEFMVELNLCFIDNKLPAGATYSYLQESTGKSSLIDHFIVSETLVADIKNLDIIESGINLSDRLPVIMELIYLLMIGNAVNVEV